MNYKNKYLKYKSKYLQTKCTPQNYLNSTPPSYYQCGGANMTIVGVKSMYIYKSPSKTIYLFGKCVDDRYCVYPKNGDKNTKKM